MCYFVTVACEADHVPEVRALLRSAFGLLPTGNRSIMHWLPADWTAFHVVSGMCSCDLYSDPVHAEEQGVDVESEIARFRSRHQKPRFRKRGWTDAKIERAIEDIRAAGKPVRRARFTGLRTDLAFSLAELTRRARTIALAIHFYSGDLDTEPAAITKSTLGLERFESDPTCIQPDVLYEISAVSRHRGRRPA